MIESWHSLLAERDVTVGNSEASEWAGEPRADVRSEAASERESRVQTDVAKR